MARTTYLNKKSLSDTLRVFVEDSRFRMVGTESIPVDLSLGRYTASALFARNSAPHYHGAAMDGIAICAEETFGASEASPLEFYTRAGRRRFSYIDTGNPLPRWANAVIMIEHVVPDGPERVLIRSAAAPWQHVRLVGEDIVATEPILPRGHKLRAFDIGALLAAGHSAVRVRCRPRVAVLPTGSELIEPGDSLQPGKVIEFNSRVISALIAEWGGIPSRVGKVADNPKAIERAVVRAVREFDVVVVLAGSSAGEHDYTVRVLGALGEVLVHGIDIMPGKPAICARIGNKPVLGLPGYPVSAIVVAQQVLQPLLAKLQGTEPGEPDRVEAVLPRKAPSRLGVEEFLRVTVGHVAGKYVATPLGRGAGVISTMVKADGFVRIDSDSEGINAGEHVSVELLRPRHLIDKTILVSGSHDPALGLLEDALKEVSPALKLSVANVGSLGGLLALARGEAHVAGSHLLDPQSGSYNIVEIRRQLSHLPLVVIHLLVREQGLIVRRGNPKRIRSVKDLGRGDIRFVNRQNGAGTRVLLDWLLKKHHVSPSKVQGYDREEYTHMAVAAAVASGLADCGMGVRAASKALGLGFIPLEREQYDLIFRRDFYDSEAGLALVSAVRSRAFRTAVDALGGYDTTQAGTERFSSQSRIASKKRPASTKAAAKVRGLRRTRPPDSSCS